MNLDEKSIGPIADWGELEYMRGAQGGGCLQPGQSVQEPAPRDAGALCHLVIYRLALRQRR